MKNQFRYSKKLFKYAFLDAAYIRGAAFAVIAAVDAVFIALGSLGALPFPALVTAVSLGGVGITAMLVFDVVSDVRIIGRLFTAPGAYLSALTPAPRWKALLAGVVTMMAADIVTMAAVICGEVWLSSLLAGSGKLYAVSVVNGRAGLGAGLLNFTAYAALACAAYLLVMTTILFIVAARKSFLYQKPARRLWSALLALAIIYIVNASWFLVAPFGTVYRYGIFFNIEVGVIGVCAHLLLTLVEAAALFLATSRLMERKLNI